MIDPENPPGRAADGNRLPPAANSFGDFVRFQEDGQLDAELAEALRNLASDMMNNAIESGGKAKGKMVLTFDFALEGRVFAIAAKPVYIPREVMMAYTQADLDNLRASLVTVATGAQRVRYADGREVTFQSVEAVKAAIEVVQAQLTAEDRARGAIRRRSMPYYKPGL